MILKHFNYKASKQSYYFMEWATVKLIICHSQKELTQ
jgi:hypothetical protein